LFSFVSLFGGLCWGVTACDAVYFVCFIVLLLVYDVSVGIVWWWLSLDCLYVLICLYSVVLGFVWIFRLLIILVWVGIWLFDLYGLACVGVVCF